MIPYGKQHVTDEDIAAVDRVLRSTMLTQGPCVPAFEEKFCKRLNVKYGTAVNSATSALHIACLSLGLKPGGLVWTSAISFVASANCAVYCGAEVDFVDINPDTFNMCPHLLEEKLKIAKQQDRLPDIVIPVHMCGQSCDMQHIGSLAKTYGFKIIEDASHAVGGNYKGQAVGSCKYSDIAVFSFHPVKIITTGEGGLAVTNNKALKNSMDTLRSHGITRDPDLLLEDDGAWYYEQQSLGFNYRMTDIAAALGISQLERLDEMVENRNKRASVYDTKLSDLPLKLPKIISDARSSFHLYVIRLSTPELCNRKKSIFQKLRNDGLGVNLHYIPIYRHPYYRVRMPDYKPLENSEDYYRAAISIPLFPNMTDDEQEKVILTISKAL